MDHQPLILLLGAVGDRIEHDGLADTSRAGEDAESPRCAGSVLDRLVELVEEVVTPDEEWRAGACCGLEGVDGHLGPFVLF